MTRPIAGAARAAAVACLALALPAAAEEYEIIFGPDPEEAEHLRPIAPPDAPIDCETAGAELAVLREDREYAEKHKSSALLGLLPIGAIMNVASGQVKERGEMLSGEYVEKATAREAAILEACATSEN